MIKKSSLLLTVLALLCFASCQKAYVPSTPESVSVGTKPGEAKASDAGSQGVTIYATSDWTATSTADWIEVYPTSGGRGVNEVCLTYTENKTGAQRSGEVVFSAGGYSETFVLVQKP